VKEKSWLPQPLKEEEEEEEEEEAIHQMKMT